MTADDIQDFAFGKPLFGRSGYKEGQVDGFLTLAAWGVRGHVCRLTACS
ncbi:DivIVA domain-containing protein [Gordonia sp. VNK21]